MIDYADARCRAAPCHAGFDARRQHAVTLLMLMSPEDVRREKHAAAPRCKLIF